MDTKDRPVWANEGIRSDDEKLTINFNQLYHLVFELDRDLLRQFFRSFPIKIWRKYPVKKFKPQIDEKKEPEFDIEHKEDLLGFVVVSPDILRTDCEKTQIEKKYPVFQYGLESLYYYNVFWPHPDESKRAEQSASRIEEERHERYFKKPEDDEPVKKDGKGVKKPDPKKKKPAQQGKKPAEDEVKIEIPSWPVDDRKAIAYNADEIAKEGMDNYSVQSTQFLVAGPALLSVSIKIF